MDEIEEIPAFSSRTHASVADSHAHVEGECRLDLLNLDCVGKAEGKP
ncbi:hypothetical protein J2129_000711 [Methanofollis sp. W23]|nr:hypothetical protein [Methanofollis sp. W23]MBP2145257.1 hypothetical protein [Methanofollis sp. W23]